MGYIPAREEAKRDREDAGRLAAVLLLDTAARLGPVRDNVLFDAVQARVQVRPETLGGGFRRLLAEKKIDLKQGKLGSRIVIVREAA